MTDIVSIRDLRVSTVIGVYDWEREIEQALTFAVDMAADVGRAAARDDINDALDYSAVAHAIKCVVIEGKFQLIESAAEHVAQRLIADFALEWVRVEVTKPIPSEGYTAVITIERRGARPMAKGAVLSGAPPRPFLPGDAPPYPSPPAAGEVGLTEHRETRIRSVQREGSTGGGA
ncbi:MAG TPA: dihydroneopterin aldolase [Trebonia sp.]